MTAAGSGKAEASRRTRRVGRCVPGRSQAAARIKVRDVGIDEVSSRESRAKEKTFLEIRPTPP